MYWYVVNTKPKQEKLVEMNLRQLGIETFYPQIQQHKVIQGKRQVVCGPLFPGYLFARFNLDLHYRAVKYARSVRKLVAFGSAPATVDEMIIEAIRARVQNGYVTVSPPSFRPGQMVRIDQGPLRGLEAVFKQQMSSQQRVVLLLRTISYQARVIVDLEQVVNL
ncbi:MAG: hypothetical protein L0Y56_20515 [Nitrospira sp.]|nr:hypothetical protein [Nitrospira sp.]